MRETTELRLDTETKLKRIAWLSSQDRSRTFNNIMHLFNEESLAICYDELSGMKAVGTDGVSKAKYGEELKTNLKGLLERMKQMAYRPGAVRQVLIPKAGKAGTFRPLGISNFEDKLVQKMTQKILESIYDPIFLDCSFGFRPGKGCHDAIKVLHHYLYKNEVETVIDVDLSNFFNSIDHNLLEELLRKKIKDERFMRYILRMFKAGVLAEGELTVSEEGVMQGSVCSPVLANIFAHAVIDEWFEEVVKPYCAGRVALFRYADDVVICCRNRRDAERIKKALGNRLMKYKLKLNEEKTKMVAFSKSQHRASKPQGTFDFLGFTFYWGKSKGGAGIVKVKTIGKRLRDKLKRVNRWLRENRNRMKLEDLWERFCDKVRGHIQYYGVSFNISAVKKFLQQSRRLLFKWVNRRSQRKSFYWEKFQLYEAENPLPKAVIYHSLFTKVTT